MVSHCKLLYYNMYLLSFQILTTDLAAAQRGSMTVFNLVTPASGSSIAWSYLCNPGAHSLL